MLSSSLLDINSAVGSTSIKKIIDSLLNYILMVVPIQRTSVLDRPKVVAGKLLVVPDS